MAIVETAGEVFDLGWGKREKVKRALKKIYKWFKSAGNVLIIGPGGTGKTTLGRILAGEFDLLIDAPADYVESISLEKYELQGTPSAEIIVPPGQPHRRDTTWPKLEADVAKGKYRGLILLSTYGYHNIATI